MVWVIVVAVALCGIGVFIHAFFKRRHPKMPAPLRKKPETAEEYLQSLVARREELGRRISGLKKRLVDLETRINNSPPSEEEALTNLLRQKAMIRGMILAAVNEGRRFEKYVAEVRKCLAEKRAAASGSGNKPAGH